MINFNNGPGIGLNNLLVSYVQIPLTGKKGTFEVFLYYREKFSFLYFEGYNF